MNTDFISILKERGFIHQCTAIDGLAVLSQSNAIHFYIGFDLTADGLHIGSLIQLMILRWATKAGVPATVLLGGFTTRVGDPTGRKDARPILSQEQIDINRERITQDITNIAGFGCAMTDNDSWLRNMRLLEYLNEFASLFSVNRMMTMDSVKDRLSNQDNMTVMEFNYSLFQAIDFLHLNDNGCNLQIGGSDQWSNIIAGVDLIRRKKNRVAYGLTTPLLTNSAGQKMGKSANGAVWLSAKKTPVDDFYQFWRNVEDEKVEEFLKLFTELPLDTIRGLMAGNINIAKASLAREVTTIVHGAHAAKKADSLAKAAFNGGEMIDPSAFGLIAGSMLDNPLSHLVAELSNISKSAAARLIDQNAVKIMRSDDQRNMTLVNDNSTLAEVLEANKIAGPFILRVGRRGVFPLYCPSVDPVHTRERANGN